MPFDWLYVRMELFTAGKPGMVEGRFSDDWLIEIDLVPVADQEDGTNTIGRGSRGQ